MSQAAEAAAASEYHQRRISSIREEMRFEIGVFHDRINALISAEAFLLISFTMALAYAGRGASASLFWISPTLAAIGLTLAALALPGVSTSFKKIVEWNVLLVDALNEAHAASALTWRPSVFVNGEKQTHADHRRSMLFSRSVPAIFMVAWVVLACTVFASR